MKKLLTLAAVTVLATGAFFASHAHPTFADGRNFTINNDSRVTITAIYISPADDSNWGDPQNSQLVRPGQSDTIQFDRTDAAGVCVFDVRIDASDGTSTKDWNVNFCATHSIDFS